MNLKNIGKVVTSKFVETGPSSYIYKKKRIYRAAFSQRLRNIALYNLHHIQNQDIFIF